MKTSRNNPQNNPKWQEKDTKKLLTTPVVDVVTSTVSCSRTGVEKNFYRFDFPSWVNIVALTENKEMVLIRQYRFGTGKEELEIPGGAIEEGEAPLEAGLRELLEETGYSGEKGRIIGKVCPNPALQHNSCYTVLVENVRQTAAPNPDEMEDIEVLIMPVDNVLANVKDGTISHGLVLNGIMFYAMTSHRKIL